MSQTAATAEVTRALYAVDESTAVARDATAAARDATTVVREPTGATKVAAGPALRIVTENRARRWPALVAGFFITLLLAAMLGAAVFHTQLAERQLEIDEVGARVQEARAEYDRLRLERAIRRSPVRLAEEAARLGMSISVRDEYLEVDPRALARQLAAAGPATEGVGQIIVEAGLLEDFRDVKSRTAGLP